MAPLQRGAIAVVEDLGPNFFGWSRSFDLWSINPTPIVLPPEFRSSVAGATGEALPTARQVLGKIDAYRENARALAASYPSQADACEAFLTNLRAGKRASSGCDAVSYTHLTLPTILRV